MTWKDFQQLGYELTEAEMQSAYPVVIKQYQLAKKSINGLLQEQYNKYLSAVGTDQYYNELVKYDRLVKLEKQIVVLHFPRFCFNIFIIFWMG